MASTSAPSSIATEGLPLASLDSVGFAYERTPALVDLSLEISPGITALIGPNGAGKSTLLALLAGRLRPSRGRVAMRGGEGRLVGYAAQHAELDPEMSGIEHLRLFGALSRQGGAALARSVERAVHDFGLESFVDLLVSRMSGGMRRRLHLAISSLGSPALWLLDEPTSGLDPHGRAALERAMIATRERGGAVLFSTHDLSFAERLCTRAVLMQGGRSVVDASPASVVRELGSFDAWYASIVGEPLDVPRRDERGGHGRGRRHRRG